MSATGENPAGQPALATNAQVVASWASKIVLTLVLAALAGVVGVAYAAGVAHNRIDATEGRVDRAEVDAKEDRREVAAVKVQAAKVDEKLGNIEKVLEKLDKRTYRMANGVVRNAGGDE